MVVPALLFYITFLQVVLSKDPVLRYQVGTKKMKTSRYQVSVNLVLAARSESCADALAS